MKYILFWLISYSVSVPCDNETTDPVTGETKPSLTLMACFEQVEKEMIKEFESEEEMMSFYRSHLIDDYRVAEIYYSEVLERIELTKNEGPTFKLGTVISDMPSFNIDQ